VSNAKRSAAFSGVSFAIIAPILNISAGAMTKCKLQIEDFDKFCNQSLHNPTLTSTAADFEGKISDGSLPRRRR
jgi:hypothetical protein